MCGADCSAGYAVVLFVVNWECICLSEKIIHAQESLHSERLPHTVRKAYNHHLPHPFQIELLSLPAHLASEGQRDSYPEYRHRLDGRRIFRYSDRQYKSNPEYPPSARGTWIVLLHSWSLRTSGILSPILRFSSIICSAIDRFPSNRANHAPCLSPSLIALSLLFL